MTFADFKVVEIVRRGNFNRTGSLFRVGMVVGHNRNRPVDDRNNAFFANQMF